MAEKLWTPGPDWVTGSQMYKFMAFVNENEGTDFKTYRELYDWSVTEPVRFWTVVWDFFDVIGTRSADMADGKVPPFMSEDWFPGAECNYAENMLRYMYGDEEAIVFRGEDKVRTSYTKDEFREQVWAAANALRGLGVKKGDVVAGYMPNLPETMIAMLAVSAIGAVWCSCATDIGPKAAVDRLGQTEPVVLISVDGYYYKGKTFDVTENIRKVIDGIPSIKNTVCVHYAGDRASMETIPGLIHWEEVIAEASGDMDDFVYERFPYTQPLVIMFSSGTTGKPKCMVQSGMGLLLNQLKELALQCDLTASDCLLYITTCSWMMWNWQAAAIGTGAKIVLYDGNPSYPDDSAVWKVLEEEKVTVFGLSASYIHQLIKDRFVPKDTVDLANLREICQTGSALSHNGFEYIYSDIKEDLFFNSIAGGTDINGCFAIANLLQPVYADELQGPGLGMKVECYDDSGNPVRDEEGELVCELPAPSMPLYFWNDPDGRRYEEAYFGVYPGVWKHGDYVSFSSETGGISFHGRSDSVLKPSGVRIGTAEIYNIVEKVDGVKESLAIGQTHEGDQRIILFVQMMDGYTLTDDKIKEIKTALRTEGSPRHVPALVFEAPDIPHTLNGKKVESAVTNIFNGRDVTNADALENPGCLTFYEQVAVTCK